MVATPCLPRDTLKDYLNGSADEQRLVAIESHLAQCPECEQTLLELEHNPDTLLMNLREQAADQRLRGNQEDSNFDSQPSVVLRAVDAVRDIQPQTMASSGPLEKSAEIGGPTHGIQRIGAYELVKPLGVAVWAW